MSYPSLKPSPNSTRWDVRTAVLLFLCTAFPISYLSAYAKQFAYSYSIVPVGFTLWALGLTFVAVLAATVSWALRRHDRPLSALPVAIAIGFYVSTVALVYAGSYISNSAWGDALSYRLVLTFAGYTGSLVSVLPVSEAWRSSIENLSIVAFVSSWLLILIGVAWLAMPTARKLSSRISASGSWPKPPNRMIAAAAIAPIVGLAYLSNEIVNAPYRMRGEPLSSFLMLLTSAKMLEMDNARLEAALADQATVKDLRLPATPPTKNVVLIMADALRADRMGVYGYHRDTTPFLSSLKASGHLHRVDMGLSTCSESFCGIASTFTSKPFHEISMLNLKLNTLLKKAGYRVRFYLSGDHRSWPYLWDFYGDDIDRFYDYRTLRARDLHDDRNLLNSFSRVEPYEGRPGFFYFFLMSSHFLGTRVKENEKFQPAHTDTMRLLAFWNEVAGTRREKGEVVRSRTLIAEELEAIGNRYDNGVLQIDSYISTIFDVLNRQGYLKNSIVVIVGDHGEALGERGYVGHTRTLYQETIRVPLLIYDSEPGHLKNDTFATQIDIAPTIAERLGLPVPASWRGASLTRPSSDRISLHQTRRGQRPCFAVVERTTSSLNKYIRCADGNGGSTEEVYDLMADPGELRNIVREAPQEMLSRLRRADAHRARVISSDCKSMECVD